MSPWPSSASAPPWSRITRESVCEETAKAIRDGMLTLIVPVMMSVEGRWVASTRWMPVARDFCARRMIESSTSAGATIIRSASSSITQRMCGSGGSPALSRSPVELAEVAAAGLAHDPVAGLHLADQVGEDVGGEARRGDHRRQQVRDVLVVVELDLLRVDQDQAHLVRRGLHQDRGEDRVDAGRTCRSRWCRRRARAASSPGRSRPGCRRSPCRARRPAARSSPAGRRRCRRGGRCGGARSGPRPRPPVCRGSARGCGCRSRPARRRGRWRAR